MNQRAALIIAAALTAFVLALIGGVVSYVTNQAPRAAAEALTTADAPAPTADLGLDPTAVQAAIQQRDAAYQQRIDQANQQLQQANQQLQQAYEKQRELAAQLNQAYQRQQQLASALKTAHQRQAQAPAQPQQAAVEPEPAQPPTQPTLPPAPPAPTYAVSADQAAAIALAAAPGATLARQPELVSFQGAAAYEVALDQGMVYVDANTGQILYNGAVAAVASGGNVRGGEHESGEHEGGEHEHED